MQTSDWLILLLTSVFAIAGAFGNHYQKIKDSSEAAVLALILGATITIYYEKLPDLKKYFGSIEQLTKDSVSMDYAGRLGLVKAQIAKIDNGPTKNLYQKQYDDIVKYANDRMSSLQNGTTIISQDDAISFATECFRNAESIIDATSYINPEKWWIDPDGNISSEGANYISSNKQAVDRHVRIRRVFIFDNKQEQIRMRKVLEANKRAGVEVSIAYKNDLPDMENYDFLLVDKKIASALDTDDETRNAQQFVVSYSMSQVEQISRDIDAIRNRAQPFR